jgi:hypothetical protein
MLCRVPTRVTNTFDVEPGYGEGNDKKDMGVTTEPSNATPPRFNLNLLKEGNAWKVQCALTPAVEGTNRSGYLGAGTYPTGLAWWPESNGFGSADDDHPEIYGIVTEDNSDESRKAEVEHCNDWIRAHKITLEAAENAIRHATPGLQNRRFDSRLAAYAGALEAFVGHSPHKKIAAVFQASVLATATRQDVLPQEFKDRLAKLFLEVGNLTAERDQKGWHHFGLGNATVPTSQLGLMDKLNAKGRDYRMLQPSNTFKVGVVLTDSLISLG